MRKLILYPPVWTTSNQNPTHKKVSVVIPHTIVLINKHLEKMETKEKKAKGAKKNKEAKSAVAGVRLIKTGNVKNGQQRGTLLGQLTESIGEGAVYELYSENNFYGASQVMLKGWFAENEPNDEKIDFKLICDADISKELRSAKDGDELNDILDSLEYADCYKNVVQSTTSKGEKRFDEAGEPIMEDLYILKFANNRADMSSTRRTSSGVANTEYKKEKKAFSFKAISGLY